MIFVQQTNLPTYLPTCLSTLSKKHEITQLLTLTDFRNISSIQSWRFSSDSWHDPRPDSGPHFQWEYYEKAKWLVDRPNTLRGVSQPWIAIHFNSYTGCPWSKFRRMIKLYFEHSEVLNHILGNNESCCSGLSSISASIQGSETKLNRLGGS